MEVDGVCTSVPSSPAGGESRSSGSPVDTPQHQAHFRHTVNTPSPDKNGRRTALGVPILSISPYQRASQLDLTGRGTPYTGTSSTPATMSSLEMEGELVEQAIDSVVNLPDAVSEVVSMHKDQSTEIQRQQHILHLLKENLKEGQKHHDAALEDIARVSRRICLTEDLVAEKKRNCQDLEITLNSLVSTIEHLKQLKAKTADDIQELTEQIKFYGDKMEKHKECTCNYEQTQVPVNRALVNMRGKVQELKTLKKGMESNMVEAEKITSGAAATNLQQQQESWQQDCKTAKDRIREKKSKIMEELKNQAQIKQNIDVLHKRNAAQMTRLKRQIKEVQSHNRQWQEQAAQLERAFKVAKKQLEE